MCGIVAILDEHADVVDRVTRGLSRLEYRGYDSAGIGVVTADGIHRARTAGKFQALEEKLEQHPLAGKCAMGHTRWATHGLATEQNAHPHVSGEVMLVHNGIIENYLELKEALLAAGRQFEGETDTEVVAHLIAHKLSETGDAEQAFAAAIHQLEGAFSLVAMFAGNQSLMLCARRGAPLTVGVPAVLQGTGASPSGSKTVYIASDPLAYADSCQQWSPLPENSWLAVRGATMQLHGIGDTNPPELKWSALEPFHISTGKGNHRHFMIKEINEQTEVLAHTIGYYLDAASGMPRDFLAAAPPAASSSANNAATGRAIADGFDFRRYDRIVMVACGTAWYSACVARYAFEEVARIPTSVELASELRYRNPVIEPRTLAIFISQSGETADTLAALRYCHPHATTMAVVNVETSALAREAHVVAPLKVGAEIGVASTKAFTAMLCALGSLTLMAARQRGQIDDHRLRHLTTTAMALPRIVAQAIEQLSQPISDLAARIAERKSVIYLGRGHLFPIAQEGALKLKEISYIHAHGYAAGELKHGPIALVEESLAVVSLIDNDHLLPKVTSNLAEVAARRGWVIAIGPAAALNMDLSGGSISKLTTPACDPFWMPVVLSVPIQLLAYHTAIEKGTDVDQPRNLAKSVTVE